jgi:predicted dehydrogenase
MARVGVGVIGLGVGERVHLPGWAALRNDGVRIVSVCGRDPAHAAAAAKLFGAAASTTDWRELVADPAVSLVSIATPPTTHIKISAAALDAGKAALCEKPLGVEAGAAQAVADRSGPPLLVNFAFRALPELRALRKRVDTAAADDFKVTWHVSAREDASWLWSWKDDVAQGGGALAMYGVHAFDYIEWLLGPVAEVHGNLTWADGKREDASGTLRPITADHAFRAHMVLASGARGELDVSLTAHSSQHRIEVANVALDLPPSPGRGPGDNRIEPFTALARELVAALRDGRSATPSGVDGVRALTLVEAVHASVKTGAVRMPVFQGRR